MKELVGSPYNWTAGVDLMKSQGANSAIDCFELVKQFPIVTFSRFSQENTNGYSNLVSFLWVLSVTKREEWRARKSDQVKQSKVMGWLEKTRKSRRVK